MQGEEGLRTVECLRGRLLAERAASRAATETADLMTAKLQELEEKLKIETKCRRKAETKLSNLKKKLENLKIGLSYSLNWEESDECSISFTTDQFSEKSNSSASTPSSSTGDHLHPRSSDNADQGGENIESDTKMEKVPETQNLCGLKKPSSLEEEREKEENERENEERVDDSSMALVPLSLPRETKDPSNRETNKVNNERVREVLDTLKQIRENIQCTIQRRRSFKVG